MQLVVRATWYEPTMREKKALRACAWCERPIRRAARRDAKTCSKSCRQKLHRFRVAPAALDGSAKPMRFCYADPPYPGLARRYYGCAEVDHEKLVRELARDFPDGWALSTSSSAAFDVLRLVRRRVDPKRVRLCIWVKGSRKGITYSARNAYEVLIVVRGRSRRLGRSRGPRRRLAVGRSSAFASARARRHEAGRVLRVAVQAARCSARRSARRSLPWIWRGHARVEDVRVSRRRRDAYAIAVAFRWRRQARRRAQQW